MMNLLRITSTNLVSHVFRPSKISQLQKIMDFPVRFMHDKGFIGGRWIGANNGKTFEVRNPATDEFLVSVPDMDETDTEEAIQHAYKTFQSWKNTTGKERSKLLKAWHNLLIENIDEISRILTLENGKPLRESRGEIMYSADYLELYAEEAKRIHGEVLQSPVQSKEMFLVRKPVGVVGMLTPWNFPVAMIARKMSAALAAGCTCVVKPAEDTPLSALYLVSLAEKAGIPSGAINVVTASRDNAASIGRKLCTSSDVSCISFTGSTATGKILYKQCASTVKRIALELGGNAPFIVFESADLNKAVPGAIASKFRNNGQTCVSTNRIFVHESLHDEFIAKLLEAMDKLVVGNGLEDTTILGPIINKAQFVKVSAMVNDAISKGAKVLIGGEAHPRGGNFYKPTLLTNVNSSMQCYKEEVFGPVVLVRSFQTEDEVIQLANDTKSGLISYFYSENLSQVKRVTSKLEFGMVGVNEGIISTAEAAFGGIKESGMGREGSKYGLDDFSYIKYVCIGGLQ